jgi:anti-sigma28 factor (negative regulator of flagellin synthesis)
MLFVDAPPVRGSVKRAMESPTAASARVEPGGLSLWSNQMSSINGLGGVSPLQPTSNATNTAAPQSTTGTQKPSLSDRLELSGVSHLLASLKTNDVRTDKVAAVKAQIASGIYDADGSKLDAATDKLLDEINK